LLVFIAEAIMSLLIAKCLGSIRFFIKKQREL